MTMRLSEITIPYFTRLLNALSGILEKAEAHCAEGKMAEGDLINARLAPDMAPLPFQVQVATDMVKGCAARLAGQTPPVFADDETTLAALRERIAKTLDFIKSVPLADIDLGADRTVTFKLGPRGDVTFSADDYVFGFVYPNLHFHATTLYAILRHNGLPLGKGDYLGAI